MVDQWRSQGLESVEGFGLRRGSSGISNRNIWSYRDLNGRSRTACSLLDLAGECYPLARIDQV